MYEKFGLQPATVASIRNIVLNALLLFASTVQLVLFWLQSQPSRLPCHRNGTFYNLTADDLQQALALLSDLITLMEQAARREEGVCVLFSQHLQEFSLS